MKNEVFRNSQTIEKGWMPYCAEWQKASDLEESDNRRVVRNKLSRIRRGKTGHFERYRNKIGRKRFIMSKITAIIERGADGLYSVYVATRSFRYGIIGTGATVNEALSDWREGLKEMKEYVEESGGVFPDVDVAFKYDVASFLQEYAYAFTLAGLERITGINQKQLGHYISGYRKPSQKTVRRIESGIHAFSEQLHAVRFI